MHFHLMHIDDEPRPVDAEEEVYLVTPGGEKTALAVPLDAVPKVLELLAEVYEGAPEQVCDACGEPLARPKRTGG